MNVIIEGKNTKLTKKRSLYQAKTTNIYRYIQSYLGNTQIQPTATTKQTTCASCPRILYYMK